MALAVFAAPMAWPRASAAGDATSPQAPVAASPGANAEIAALTAARDRLQANLPLVQQRAGHDVAFGLGVRLLDDMDTVRAADQTPAGYTPAQWGERISEIVRLDTTLADEMVSGTVETPATAHGLQERLMRSAADGTLQPYAIYAPPGAIPHIHLTLTDEYPYAQAQVLIEAR